MNSAIKSQTQQFSIEALIFVIILLIYLLTSHLTDQKQVSSAWRLLRYFHQSTLAIFMGILTALFAKQGMDRQFVFSDQLFFDIVLPMVIFSAGYGARKSKMLENSLGISVIGIVGTILGFVLLAVFIGTVNAYLFKILTLKQVLLLSSVLCATDTVAAMSLIKVKKFPTLSSIVFGQSIFNNSVSIILFHTISKSVSQNQQNQLNFWTYLTIFINFIYMFGFSVAFGVLTGFALSYLFKKYESFVKKPIREVGLILLNGYFTYLLGELVGLSGVIALFTCAGVMGRYTHQNVSIQAKKGTQLAFDTVSYIAQAFIFAYLGASILAVQGQWSAIFMAAIILISLPFIRALMVALLPLSHLFLRQKQPLSLNQLKICWFSGMIRGAVAFALSLQVGSRDKKYLITVSLMIVMVTSVLGSTFLRKFKQIIGLKITQEQGSQDLSLIETDRTTLKYMDKKSQKKQNIIQNPSTGSFAHRLAQFQQNYIKPKFIRVNKKISYNLEKSMDESAKETEKNLYTFNDDNQHEHENNQSQFTSKTQIEQVEPPRNMNRLNRNLQKNKQMILQI